MAEFYAIEPGDRADYNQLIDWWRRQNQNGQPGDAANADNAVPILLLQAPHGWTRGRYCPMVIDSDRPFSYDVCLIGYPLAYELGRTTPGTFKVIWQGEESSEIRFDATAIEFRQALPQSLREICKVTGGRIDDIIDNRLVTYRPGRWFVSLAAPIKGLTALPLTGGIYDSVVLRISESPMACGSITLPCWSMVNRTTAPKIAVGSLALGWYVQAFGLMVGVVEPRIYETYENRLTYPTTTTTPEPTTTTTGAPTTTGPPTTTVAPTTTTGEPTTTTTSGPTTTTTSGPTTTTTSEPLGSCCVLSSNECIDSVTEQFCLNNLVGTWNQGVLCSSNPCGTTTTAPPPTTTTVAGTTTTTAPASTTTSVAGTTTTASPPSTTTTAPPTTTTVAPPPTTTTVTP